MPTLATYLSGSESLTSDQVLERFLAWVSDLGLELYPAQEEAILELFAGRHLVLSTPTGSGKSLVATALHRLSDLPCNYVPYSPLTEDV